MPLLIDAGRNIIDTGAAALRTLRPATEDPLDRDANTPVPVDSGTKTIPVVRAKRHSIDPTRKTD